MKKLSVIKNNISIQDCIFEDDKTMQDFIEMLANTEAWGKPERWIQDTPMSPLSAEEKAKAKANRVVKGPMGEDITEYQFEAEYKIDIKDITAEVKSEKDKKDKKEKDRKDRVTSLKNIDWAKIKNFNDALPILQALVNEQLKDD